MSREHDEIIAAILTAGRHRESGQSAVVLVEDMFEVLVALRDFRAEEAKAAKKLVFPRVIPKR